MKIRDVMETSVASCAPSDTLDDAVRLLWERDCGVLPVVGPEGDVVGVVTDRDACMGAWMRHRRLDEIPVADSMAGDVQVCRADDSVERAMSTMAEAQVRRLPVVDRAGRLEGLVSMNDLFRAALGETRPQTRRQLNAELVESMASVCEPRHGPADLQPAGSPRGRRKAHVGKDVG